LSILSSKFLIVTSLQEGKYADLVLHEIKKRISLGQEKYNRVAAHIYNHSNRS
jgi:hypothetical protein